jgi:hypothetical protein
MKIKSVKSLLLLTGAALSLVAILVIVIVAVSQWTLPGRMDGRINAIIEVDKGLPVIDSDVDVAGLPAPLQLYSATALGEEKVRGVAMRVKGRLKLPGTDEWLPIEGQQYISAIRPAFLWNMRATIGGPLWVDIQDHYESCSGQINSKAFSLYPILDERDIPELTVTQLARWSGLIVLVPPALVNNPHITWHPVDENSAIAQVRECDIMAEHLYVFDDKGLVIRSESSDRYELYEGRGYEKTGSIMHRTQYKIIDGMSIPSESSVIRIEDGVEIEFLNETFYDIRFVE